MVEREQTLQGAGPALTVAADNRKPQTYTEDQDNAYTYLNSCYRTFGLTEDMPTQLLLR